LILNGIAGGAGAAARFLLTRFAENSAAARGPTAVRKKLLVLPYPGLPRSTPANKGGSLGTPALGYYLSPSRGSIGSARRRRAVSLSR